jgi:CDP-archaeol synthase
MRVRWVFVPVMGAALAHAPVLRFDLLPGLDRPIDAGATFRGRRVFGDNKTWRGAITMFSGVLGAAVLLWRSESYRGRLPQELQHARPGTVGGLLGASVVLGELPNSFLKRQLDIRPGGHVRSPAGILVSLVDQCDFVPAAWLFLRPVCRMSLREAIDTSLTVTAIHLAVNVIGYALGARTTAI